MKNNIKKAPVKFREDQLYFQHFDQEFSSNWLPTLIEFHDLLQPNVSTLKTRTPLALMTYLLQSNCPLLIIEKIWKKIRFEPNQTIHFRFIGPRYNLFKIMDKVCPDVIRYLLQGSCWNFLFLWIQHKIIYSIGLFTTVLSPCLYFRTFVRNCKIFIFQRTFLRSKLMLI